MSMLLARSVTDRAFASTPSGDEGPVSALWAPDGGTLLPLQGAGGAPPKNESRVGESDRADNNEATSARLSIAITYCQGTRYCANMITKGTAQAIATHQVLAAHSFHDARAR